MYIWTKLFTSRESGFMRRWGWGREREEYELSNELDFSKDEIHPSLTVQPFWAHAQGTTISAARCLQTDTVSKQGPRSETLQDAQISAVRSLSTLGWALCRTRLWGQVWAWTRNTFPGVLWMQSLSLVTFLCWCKLGWASWPQEQKTNPVQVARETGTASCVNVGPAHCSWRVDGWVGGV